MAVTVSQENIGLCEERTDLIYICQSIGAASNLGIPVCLEASHMNRFKIDHPDEYKSKTSKKIL